MDNCDGCQHHSELYNRVEHIGNCPDLGAPLSGLFFGRFVNPYRYEYLLVVIR